MKSTKKSLWSSGLSLLVCLALLVGTTFAWFTDSVSNKGNKIQAGRLDIALEELQDGEYVDISNSNDPIFNYDNWEPGYSDVAVLKLVNKGTLALKYQLDIVANGTASKLAEVIDVYAKISDTAITEELSSFENLETEGYENVGTLAQLIAEKDGAAHGHLLKGEAAYAGIVLHMQETAGNEYQNKSVGTTFDIVVNATQYTYEKDGFGSDQYDANATSWSSDAATEEEMAAITDEATKTVSISTPRQLAGLATLVNNGNCYEGYTVNLMSDIDLGNRPWTPIGNTDVPAGEWSGAVFSGSFNGNDYTISNLYIDSADKTADVGFFGMLNLPEDASIKNINFENAYVNGEQATGVGVLAGAACGGVYNDQENYMPCLIENITVKNATVNGLKYVGGIIGYSTTCLKNVTVSDTNVSANYSSAQEDSGENAGAVVGDLYALFSIDNVNVSGCVVSGKAKLSAVAGSSHHADMIKNCTVSDVQMIIDADSTDARFGWISGRAASINIPKYIGNTVTNCTATKGGQPIHVEDIYAV